MSVNDYLDKIDVTFKMRFLYPADIKITRASQTFSESIHNGDDPRNILISFTKGKWDKSE